MKKKKLIYRHDVTVFKTRQFKVIVGLSVPEARPHLIMLFTDRRGRTEKTIFDFNPTLFNQWITALQKSFFHFPVCIFSVHLGLYQSKDSPHFHAHYILPIDEYMDLIIEHQGKNVHDDFLDQLEDWPLRLEDEGNKYKQHDLKTIAGFTKQKINKFRGLPQLSRNYSIRFHSNQPRIAFMPNKKNGPDHSDLRHLVLAMMEFIEYYRLNNRRVGGCHLCLQNYLYVDHEFKGVPGFLQIDPANYYLINPDREIWLKNFKKKPYIVMT